MVETYALTLSSICHVTPLAAADMTAEMKAFIPERMMLPEDIAEAAMLAVRTSQNAVPQEITMRLTKSAMKSS